jgi:hypothetical protein
MPSWRSTSSNIMKITIIHHPLETKDHLGTIITKTYLLLTWMDGSDIENTNTLGITSKHMTLLKLWEWTIEI